MRVKCPGLWQLHPVKEAPEPLDVSPFPEATQPRRRSGRLEIAARVEHPVHADARVHRAAGQDLRAKPQSRLG